MDVVSPTVAVLPTPPPLILCSPYVTRKKRLLRRLKKRQRANLMQRLQEWKELRPDIYEAKLATLKLRSKTDKR